MELCICCGGDMYPLYIGRNLEYKELQCDTCSHIMKVGYNKDDGRLKEPNPSHKNNIEI
jgi:hypothetical protein